MGGKLPRGNIRGGQGSWLEGCPGFLPKAGQTAQTLAGVEDEDRGEVSDADQRARTATLT